MADPARRRVVLAFAAVLALDSADRATLGAVAAELSRHSTSASRLDRVMRVRLLAGSVAP